MNIKLFALFLLCWSEAANSMYPGNMPGNNIHTIHDKQSHKSRQPEFPTSKKRIREPRKTRGKHKHTHLWTAAGFGITGLAALGLSAYTVHQSRNIASPHDATPPPTNSSPTNLSGVYTVARPTIGFAALAAGTYGIGSWMWHRFKRGFLGETADEIATLADKAFNKQQDIEEGWKVSAKNSVQQANQQLNLSGIQKAHLTTLTTKEKTLELSIENVSLQVKTTHLRLERNQTLQSEISATLTHVLTQQQESLQISSLQNNLKRLNACTKQCEELIKDIGRL